MGNPTFICYLQHFCVQFRRKSFWLHTLTIELVITGLGSDRRLGVIKQRDNSPIWDQNTRPARAAETIHRINENKRCSHR